MKNIKRFATLATNYLKSVDLEQSPIVTPEQEQRAINAQFKHIETIGNVWTKTAIKRALPQLRTIQLYNGATLADFAKDYVL